MEQESDTSFSLKNDAETNKIPPMNMQSRVWLYSFCSVWIIHHISIVYY